MTESRTQRKSAAQSRTAWLKQQSFRKNPFKGSGRNRPNLDDAFILNRSTKNSESSEAETLANDELPNQSVCSLSSSLIATNRSFFSIGSRATAKEHLRHLSKTGFDASILQTPSPISDPSNEDWERYLDGNVSLLESASFFEGKSDSYEPSLYESQFATDQSSSDYFENSSRLKLLETPEKNRQKVDEATRLALLGIHGSSKFTLQDEEDEFELASSSLSRFGINDRSHLEESKDLVLSPCSKYHLSNQYASPEERNGRFKHELSDVAAEEDSMKNQRNGDEEELLAENVVKRILGLHQDTSLGAIDLSKLTINESCEGRQSPSLGSGFFSEQHRSSPKLGFFELSPIVAEKGPEQRRAHNASSKRYAFNESPLPSCPRKKLFLLAYGDTSHNEEGEQASDFLSSYACTNLSDSRTHVQQSNATPDEDFMPFRSEVLFDDHDNVLKHLSTYSSSSSLDSSTPGRRILTPKKKLFDFSSEVGCENEESMEGFFLTTSTSRTEPTIPKAKQSAEISCISFAEFEFSPDISFSSTTRDYGGVTLTKTLINNDLSPSATLQTASSSTFLNCNT